MKIKGILLIVAIIFGINLKAQNKNELAIKDYGKMKYYENVAVKPDPKQKYNVLMRVTKDIESHGVNKTLWHVARLLNLLKMANVPEKNIHIVAVFSGKAFDVVFNNEKYNNEKGKDNPNIDLINKLVAHNVDLHICGQTLADNNLNHKKDILPQVKLTYSAMTDVIMYSKKGYVIFE